MFTGVCAFPLTPMAGDAVDMDTLVNLVRNAADAGVESLGILGSTGLYPYLDRRERCEVIAAAVAAANGVPVIAGIGALRTRDALRYAEDAQEAGAAALLVAPVSYHRLTEQEVLSLYTEVTSHARIPVVVYDNPGTTGFTFSDEFHGRIAHLPGVAAVKIPPMPAGTAAERVAALRTVLPEGVALGISGDWAAAEALEAGCDLWFSVLAGLFPSTARTLADAALSGRDTAAGHAMALEPLWELFRRYGSLRVVATAAGILGHTTGPVLPSPLKVLEGDDARRVEKALRRSGLLG
ncbi:MULTISPECIES: dihydrodipicolinate synthase family protein [Arthrobacter]|uniref:Dihydrodipicolinate synthase family protein n=2 Tax=Arthrobacter TaxID=1663 RepID=A0ABU9KKT1_9MICC|nr:dihydrodipicolinate synthase family protein [Arthrobacter sp. YJM1]MDP5227516.1 dihydrodipicolinate synthase family protein [Arthrobacter sp. YJM1]